MTRDQIRQILNKEGFRPLKSLGQNFLCDRNLAQFIADALEAPAGSEVVEIGPGLGSLTRPLLENKFSVTAIELDKGLGDYLEKELGPEENFTLTRGDAVKCLHDHLPVNYLTGNLPYNISTPLLAELLQQEHLPASLVFTLQWETGQRFAAPPNTRDYGAVTVLLQSCYEVETLRKIGPGVFYPEPNVDSVVFRARRREASKLDHEERKTFYRLLRKAFSQRRKKLRNTVGIDSDLRPEHLTVDEWMQAFLSSE
jgi:16S rRNA (adenine1518-N6/adenine1519-N6)-dimethyltransferase